MSVTAITKYLPSLYFQMYNNYESLNVTEAASPNIFEL